MVFGQTVRHEFINCDDDQYVYENPQVARGFTAQGIVWAFTHFHSANWHPLTWLSHMLDCQLYGLNHPGGHHLTNVLLHAASAILLFLVLRQMTGDLWPSAFVAALFAIHPLHVESVAWVAERKDVLSGLFFMLTLAAYVGYARRPFSLLRYLLVTVLFALGLMAKPMLVTLPFVLLLLDYWPLGRIGAAVPQSPQQARLPRQSSLALRRVLLEKLPWLVLTAASCVVTRFAQQTALVSTERLPLPSRIANALVSYVAYLGQFFYPVGLAVLYPYPQSTLPIWKIVGALLLLVGISLAVLACRRKCPYLLVGWLWYLGMLVPVIGLVQVGDQSMADRYTYLTQIGLYIALAWGCGACFQALALSSLPFLGSLGDCRCRSGVVCLATGVVLERQRDSMATHVGLHLGKLFGPQQPRPGSGRPRAGQRGHCPLPEGPGNQSRLRGGPQQPRSGSGRPRAGQRGHRPLPEGPGNQSRLRGGPLQPR